LVIRASLARASFGFAPEAKKGIAAFAPPNIGGVSEGRGGFAALRIPHAAIILLPPFLQNFTKKLTCKEKLGKIGFSMELY
jgi:hypothetical protein